MTTNYTSTVDITTPSVTLTDFTAVVPASLGVNVYGAATDADINTFDIGPTGDSNILLQTLAVGGHYVHDGTCHNSADGTVPPYGVHGIYDKSNGTLVETVEFYDHPNGQGYSPRYANACKGCLFHDTPYSIGLFNYQGAAVGSGGSLRIRDGIFYNVPSGGYIFYSDGLWLESNGTVLGNSLISVEIDHCTIDVRGVAQPFDFSQCHNDVYLTNCVIISDSGLPLSSIITPPLDSSVVHLDGSIVLDSADAATYLGPAPTFAPIAVGGSPVIGTAVASPPASFAEWGNEGDLGATQTGSSPPGPPPLPGPSIPGIDIFVCGEAGGSTDTLVVPITADVPATTTDGGATFVFVFYQIIDDEGSTITGISDDAPVGDSYALCVFDDGLNHYDANTQPGAGLIVSPLVDGTNNITLTLSSVPEYVQAMAVAVTGLSLVTNVSTGDGLDPSLSWWPGSLLQFAEAPTGTPTTTSIGPAWNYSDSGAVTFTAPVGATDEDWDYQSGVLALFWVFASSLTDQLGWTWDGDITDFAQWDVEGFVFQSFALGTAEVDPGVAVTTVTGVFGDGTWPNSGNSIALRSGPGPTCTSTPPPASGYPVFNNHIRLSE